MFVPPDTLAVLALALLAEAAAGYPNALYRRIGHPVTWIGFGIAVLDGAMNRKTWSSPRRRAGGLMALALVLLATGLASGAVVLLSGAALGGDAAIVVLALVGSALLAQRSLHEHVARVAQSLRGGGLAAGRQAVSHIVGRNPETLDEPAVCRAAIESLAENFSDGVIAPAFWIGAGGLVGGALYKAINTADSMIGHKTERHAAFGWAAARLDDLVNLPASRLAALLLVAAAALQRDASALGALRVVLRDARRHRSPNAGWPEAATAGALGLKLAGPRIYGDVRIEDGWMGDGREAATPDDIERALALFRKACAILWALAAALALVTLASR
jgi:adenosylcobinamide-phosphate synthase